MRDRVLDEAAAFFKFLAVVRGFGSEGTVFEPVRFGQVIIDTNLGRSGQVEKRKHP